MKLFIYGFLFAVSIVTAFSQDEQPDILINIEHNYSISKQSNNDPRYIENQDTSEIREVFVNEIKESFETGNYRIIKHDNVAFTIVINSFVIKESTRDETVEDPNSEYNGQMYTMYDCSIETTFNIYKGNKEKMIKAFSVYAGKEEKLKNNQNLAQYILGQNKDGTEYRQKLLNDDVFVSLTEKAARKLQNKADRLIEKFTKNKQKE